MRSSLPIDLRSYEITGGTPINLNGNQSAGVGLPDNCHAFLVQSGSKAIKLKFVGASETPSTFYASTNCLYIPPNSSIRLDVGVSSRRVGSSFVFFDSVISQTSTLKIRLFMEAFS